MILDHFPRETMGFPHLYEFTQAQGSLFKDRPWHI